MAIEAILFDVDGTLIDSVIPHAKAWREAFLQYEFDISVQTIRLQIGKGGDLMVRDLLPEVRSGEARESLTRDLSQAHGKIFAHKYLSDVRGFAGVADFFALLRQDGKKIALASAAEADELEQFKKLAGIENFDLPQASSSDVAMSKPYPDIFQAARDRLGKVGSAACVVVGDSPYDMQAARAAGMATVGLLSGGFARTDLVQSGGAVVYDDIAALLRSYRKKRDAAFMPA